MTKGRLEAFSDGVIAILITILVLELKIPHGHDWAAFQTALPTLSTYLMCFIYLGIYWNNHHHMLHATEHITGSVLWANLHLLFWLSLLPFAAGWVTETHFASLPTALCGVDLFMAGVGYYILTLRLIAHHGPNSRIAQAVGKDFKGKISLVFYAAAIPLAFVNPWIAHAIYVLVAGIWLVPDPRIEARLNGTHPPHAHHSHHGE